MQHVRLCHDYIFVVELMIEHPAEYLWRILLEIVRSYPDGTAPVPAGYRIEGLGCFPCGYGLWDKLPGVPPPPMPVRGIMLLAHNWGSVYELDRYKKSERRNSPYWRNLRPLLERAGISMSDCFATNAYPGLVTAKSNMGKFPGTKDRQFQDATRQFLNEQIRVVSPALIVTLGIHVPPLLACLSDDLSGWRKVSAFGHLNNDNAIVERARFTDAGHTATVVALTHPSQRRLNVKHRTYRGRQGDDAEEKVLGYAWKVAKKLR